jgi:4-hydroxy-tetrahydrodipicolinate reductase
LAERILSQLKRKKKWVDTDNEKSDEIVIKSFRIDDVPGTHVVSYESPVDNIELKHTAHSREGFALGAVMVAEWLPGKKGILTMDDFLKF